MSEEMLTQLARNANKAHKPRSKNEALSILADLGGNEGDAIVMPIRPGK